MISVPDYSFWIVLLGVALVNVTGMAAVWVALGRGHWFIRAAALAAWLGVWLLVPAYEITAILLVESFVIVSPLALVRRARTREPGQPIVQYTIRDLLLVAVLVAVTAAAGAATQVTAWSPVPWFLDYQDAPAWCSILVNGAINGALVLFAAWAVLGRSRLAIRLGALVVGVAILLVLLRLWLVTPAPGAAARPVVTSEGAWAEIAPIVLGLPVLPAIVLLAVAILRRSRAADAKRSRSVGRSVGRVALAGLLIAIAAGLVAPPLVAFLTLVTPPPTMPDEPPPPEPNGYDTLVRVGGKLATVNIPFMDENLPPEQRTGPDAFRAFRRQYDALLSEARAALDTPCRVPIPFDPSNMVNIQGFRQLARGLHAAGRAAAFDGDVAAAVDCHLDTIRLGKEATRGGIVIDSLVGMAIEGIGLQSLFDERASLGEPVRRDIIRRLTDLQGQRERLEDTWRRDKVWEAKAYGWQGRLFQALGEWNGETFGYEAFAGAGRLADARFQLLLAELALAGYRDKHGAWPETLDSLAPEWLDKAPKDPFGDGPLVYRRTDGDYKLYSVGANGRNDDRKSYMANDPDGDDVWFW